jgi:endonuclease/exonuclease/phosphatase family metal-dependent hydrolase
VTDFSIMTWNVENLFLPDPGSESAVRERFDRKLTLLAAAIDEAAPTVLALQEVGGPEALQALQRRLRRPLPFAAIADPDERGIRCAIMSSLPIDSQRQVQRFPDRIRPVQTRDPEFDDPATPAEDESLTNRLSRAVQEATVTIGAESVTVLCCHFKSKLIRYPRRRGLAEASQFNPGSEDERYRYGAYALYRRTGEAMAVRDRVNRILDGGVGRQRAVVVCGDLNDGPDAATTQLLQGPSGSELFTEGFRTGDRGDGDRLWNLAPLLNRDNAGNPPATPPFSRRFRDRGELIDHIFASQRLVNPGNLPTAVTITAAGGLPSITERPSDRRDEAPSDHSALLASFRL